MIIIIMIETEWFWSFLSISEEIAYYYFSPHYSGLRWCSRPFSRPRGAARGLGPSFGFPRRAWAWRVPLPHRCVGLGLGLFTFVFCFVVHGFLSFVLYFVVLSVALRSSWLSAPAAADPTRFTKGGLAIHERGGPGAGASVAGRGSQVCW